MYHLHYTKVCHEVPIFLCLQLEKVHDNDGEHDLKNT